MAAKNLIIVGSSIPMKQVTCLLRGRVLSCPQFGLGVSDVLGQTALSRCSLGLDVLGSGSRCGKSFPARHFSTTSSPQSRFFVSSLRFRSLGSRHGSFLGQASLLEGWTRPLFAEMNNRHFSNLSCLSPYRITFDDKRYDTQLITGLTSCYPFLDCDTPLLTQQRGYRSHNSYRSSDKGHRKDSPSAETSTDGQTGSEAGVKNTTETTPEGSGEDPGTAKPLTLYQRFKKTYKEHGKVLVVVHLITSAVWFGSFYTAARCGIDIVPYLESWNLSEKVISPFRSGGLGDVALAYLMYKLATPARYTVTIGGTNLAIRYLRKEGKMKPVPKEDTLRSLYKEGKEDLKRRSDVRRRRRKSRQTKRQHLQHPPHKEK